MNKKWTKVVLVSQSKDTPKLKEMICLPNMTQILYQKGFITFSENKYGQNHGQCSEKVEGGLSGGLFLVKNIDLVEKKSLK